MKLTRENIEEQLKKACCGYLELEDKVSYLSDDPNKWFMQSKLYNLTVQLIKEHYDNSPLKIDDLKRGMWVWDNFLEEYVMISDIIEVDGNYYFIFCDYRDAMCYDEKRFYKQEVRK